MVRIEDIKQISWFFSLQLLSFRLRLTSGYYYRSPIVVTKHYTVQFQVTARRQLQIRNGYWKRLSQCNSCRELHRIYFPTEIHLIGLF